MSRHLTEPPTSAHVPRRDSTYDAFVSYCRVDSRVASSLERSLRRFATPWYGTRRLRVFRDESSLGLDPSLWGGIERGLQASRWFILVASPESASRPWVRREVAWWLENRGTSQLIVVLAAGDITWQEEEAAGRLVSDSLPPSLTRAWRQEPMWLDLRNAAHVGQIRREDSAAYVAVAGIVAAIEGVPKDDLIGTDVLQRRRALRLLRMGVTVLGVLAVIAGLAAVVALHQRNRAVAEERLALANERRANSVALASQAHDVQNQNPALALALAAAAYRTTPRPLDQAVGALVDARSAFAQEDWHEIGLPTLGDQSSIGHVVFSPDGSRLASGSDDGMVRMWNPRTGRELGHSVTLDRAGSMDSPGVAFSADGSMVAAVSAPASDLIGGPDKSAVRRWDPATGQAIGQPLHARGCTTHVVFSPDGRLLACGGWGRAISMWDPVTGRRAGPTLMVPGGSGNDVSLAISPNGRLLAAATWSRIMLWDIRAHRWLPRPLVGTRNWEPAAIAFSPDSRHLAAGGLRYGRTNLGQIHVWDIATGSRVSHDLPAGSAQGGDAWSVAYSPDGELLASGGGDNEVRMWDPVDVRPIGRPLHVHGRWVNSIAFSPDSHMLATGGSDTHVRVWEVPTRDSADGFVQVAPTATVLPSHWDPGHLVFSADGSELASTNDEGSTQVWLTGTHPRLRLSLKTSLDVFHDDTSDVAFSPDQRMLAVSGDPVRLFDIPSGSTAATLPGADSSSLAFSPDGTTLAVGTWNNTVQLWSTRSWRREGQPLGGQRGQIDDVAFNPSGTLLASASEDGTIGLYDVRSEQPVGPLLTGHAGPVASVVFSPDGGLLASGSGDGTVRLWDAQTGQSVGDPLVAQAGYVHSVAFSPDGELLAASSTNGSVQLWSTTTRTPVGSPMRSGHDLISAVAFSPTGALASAQGVEHAIRIWNVLDVAYACRLAARYVTASEVTARSITGRPTAGCHLPAG